MARCLPGRVFRHPSGLARNEKIPDAIIAAMAVVIAVLA
jgi:hypothetical protein